MNKSIYICIIICYLNKICKEYVFLLLFDKDLYFYFHLHLTIKKIEENKYLFLYRTKRPARCKWYEYFWLRDEIIKNTQHRIVGNRGKILIYVILVCALTLWYRQQWILFVWFFFGCLSKVLRMTLDFYQLNHHAPYYRI